MIQTYSIYQLWQEWQTGKWNRETKDFMLCSDHLAAMKEKEADHAKEMRILNNLIESLMADNNRLEKEIAILKRDNEVMAALNDSFPGEIIKLEKEIERLRAALARRLMG